MLLTIRVVVAAAIAVATSIAVATPELITLLIMSLPVFGISFWVLGFFLKKDS